MVFCAPTTTGVAGETLHVVKTGEVCRMNPAASVGHVKITIAPAPTIVGCGVTGSEKRKAQPPCHNPSCRPKPSSRKGYCQTEPTPHSGELRRYCRNYGG